MKTNPCDYWIEGAKQYHKDCDDKRITINPYNLDGQAMQWFQWEWGYRYGKAMSKTTHDSE